MLNTLQDIAKLKKDWNGYGADPIPKDVIEKAKQVLAILRRRPEIYPTANHSINLEYDYNTRYMEIEVCQNELKVFELYDRREDRQISQGYKNYKEYSLSYDDINLIPNLVENFLSKE